MPAHKHAELIKIFAELAQEVSNPHSCFEYRPNLSPHWIVCGEDISWNPRWEYRLKVKKEVQWVRVFINRTLVLQDNPGIPYKPKYTEGISTIILSDEDFQSLRDRNALPFCIEQNIILDWHRVELEKS